MNDEHDACIADFGLSRILEVSGFTTQSVNGTYRWMACELLVYELLGRGVPRITAASDTWAFGMTVLEVRSSQPFLAWSCTCLNCGPDTHGATAVLSAA